MVNFKESLKDLPARRKRQLTWISLGMIAILLQYMGSHFPALVESIYGQIIYPALRIVLDHTLAFLPIPVVVLLFFLILLLAVKGFLNDRRMKRPWSLSSFFWRLGSTLGALIFLFSFLWGWNYPRPDVGTRLGLEKGRLDSTAIANEFTLATEELLTIYASDSLQIRQQSSARRWDWDEILRSDVERVVQSLGYNTSGRVQVRVIRWHGFLLVWNTAGIYIPYSGEGHADGGLLEIQIPPVVAHEMAHGYGVTDEGDCNFLSWLACRQSSNPFVRYSSALSYWRQVAFSYRRIHKQGFEATLDRLPPAIRSDLEEIRKNNERFPELFPKLRNLTYDRYLKTQGVREGLLSYGRVVSLVHFYRLSGKESPLLQDQLKDLQ